MRWLLIIPFLCAMTPLHNDYKDGRSLFNEFRNIMDNAQDQSFTQVTSTPNWEDLRDGSFVIYVPTRPPTAQNMILMLRVGTTIYHSPMFPIMRGK